ncbi:hypothetical protein DPMN_139255 [Dreissena polymorpha]|uniref:RING-type domain-containing protein n=1 Tax=Dreissena polymorpha TaxID=45954 RepID=A0A9D4GBA0_DREPO|nr:hypothetical protein DPMN_139255 [Dreissena polymorpha]
MTSFYEVFLTSSFSRYVLIRLPPRSVRFLPEQPIDLTSVERSKTFVKPLDPAPEPEMLRAEDVKEEFLVCSICTREYDEEEHVPRVLPCLHTFCQQCLKKLVKGNLKQIETRNMVFLR